LPLTLPVVLWLAQTALPQAQTPQIPHVDIAVEVIANAPLSAKVVDYSRRLSKRAQTPSVNRVYPPTILEIIQLVKPNPVKPRGKHWDSIGAVSVGYDPETQLVSVEYCIDFCARDPKTGAFDAKRKMVSYSALEPTVLARLNRQLDQLKKYAE